VLPKSTSNQSYFIKNLFTKDTAQSAGKNQPQGTLTKKNVHCDDLNYRVDLFYLITKSGNDFKFLDPELTNECLIFILDNSLHLIDRHRQLMFMFKHLLENPNNFGFLTENLINSLSIFLLDFSFFLTNTLNSLNLTDQTHLQPSTSKHLNKVQLEDLSLCVDLLQILIKHLAQIDCINHVVLCLCELLDLVWQNKIYLQKSDYQLNRLDSQMFEQNEQIAQRIFECMNSMLCSHIMNCALFSFFNEIFSLNKRYNLHHLNQINGALMHIKKLFDDFKQSQKHKTSDLVKQLHLNCFIYLPDALRSCTRDVQKLEHVEQFKRFIIYENILNLSIDLIHLATHRDFFMCMFTFNSRKFFIEIISHFAEHTSELNENLLRKYADLLNLLDKKDVFACKTAVMKSELNSSSMSSFSASNSLMSQSMTKSFTQAQRDSTSSEESNILKFHKFQDVFYELVYKFPYANYLKDNCLNNCIDYYLQRKYLPYYGDDAINGINVLLEKYFSIQKQHSPIVRKFLIDSLHKRLKEFYDMDHIMFIQKVISEALLPTYEKCIQEDYTHFLNVLKSSSSATSTQASVTVNSSSQQAYQELIEMKCFITNKLIELTQWHCNNEANMLKLISLFELIITLESKSSIDSLITQFYMQQQQPPGQIVQIHQNNNLNYLYKIINHGLIDVFEKHFAVSTNDCFTLSCVNIIKILIKYLNEHYDNQKKSQTNPQQSQSNIILFNYYALIRRDIFEFLLRIRSTNSTNRLCLKNRSNHFKVQESKYLMLTLSSNSSIFPMLTQSQQQQMQEKAKYLCKRCEIDLGSIMDLIEKCLDQEIDWNVLILVLTDLPYFLQYELGILKHTDVVHKLFRHIYKQEISVFLNRPENMQRSDYMEKFYPLLASLTLYYPILERSSQEAILHAFAYGINSIRNRFCLEILTIAITEMHESNSIQCGDILLKLSQFSPSQNMAQPILELLSTVSDFKRLDFIFGRKELYISILATAIKYTNPVKFNSFIVQFAHYVICIWFMKCHKDIRKNYATFTCKGLYKEVIMELELLKDNKSPNKSSSTNELLSNDLVGSNLQNKENEGIKFKSNQLTENMKQFYKELVDITIDFMSNNMNFDEATYPQIGSTQNRHGFFIDTYPMASKLVSNVSNSLVNGSSTDSKAPKVQKRLWLMGDKIIEIRTGLYSNICQEKLPVLVRNNQRQAHISSNSTSNQSNSTTATTVMHIGNHQPTTKSKFIDIPSTKQLNTIESCVSSESSISNSFSSISLSSNCHTPGNIFDSNGGDKLANNVNSKTKSVNEIESNDTKKFEAVLFDDTSIDTSLNNKSLTQDDKCNENNSSQIETNNFSTNIQIVQSIDEKQSYKKKIKSFKRRYKSGLPLTTESIDNELKDDAYLLPFNESSLNKLSKDDSVLNVERTSSHDLIRSHHHHHRSHRHQRVSQLNDLDDHSFESFRQKDNSNSSSDEFNKDICNANCWCNNLVEIKCRYSTKEYSYVTLIENTNSSFHSINMSLFENILEKSKVSINDDSKGNKINTQNNITLARLAQTACESRRNAQLSRISESSTTTNQDVAGSSNLINNSPSITSNDIERKPQTPSAHTDEFLTDETQSKFRNRKLTRMSSLESNPHQTSLNKQQEFTTNSSLMSSTSSILKNKISTTNFSKYNSRYTKTNSIDPAQVFLQLFQSKHIYNEEKEQPVLLPDNDSIERSIGILDFIPCFTLHKIGVIYIGPNQPIEEKNILTNSYGSLRYKNFINGLGNLIYLKGLETNRFYAGGLETDGSIGEFSLLWYDGVVQVSFHVATMMLTKESVNSKKRHIGNDATIIVYNESGEEYQFGTIKGEVNCICIEILPLKSNTNIVKVKTTPEITQSSWFYHTDPKFVSDQNLSLVVRKMALHADMAAKIYRSQKDSNLYGGKWYERLKLINRIRKIAKEHNAKQLQQQAKTTNGPNDALSSLNTNALNSKINVSSLNNTDFTNYI
jgi:hypothetical protein